MLAVPSEVWLVADGLADRHPSPVATALALRPVPLGRVAGGQMNQRGTTPPGSLYERDFVAEVQRAIAVLHGARRAGTSEYHLDVAEASLIRDALGAALDLAERHSDRTRVLADGETEPRWGGSG